jgi:tetratricopeptide (TPR) repeat protein
LQAARAARRADLPDRAEDHLAACEKAGGGAEVSLERAMLLVQQGDLGEFEAALQERIAADDPDAGLLLEALARGYLRIGRFPQAMQSLNRLLEREPNHPWAYFWRGSLNFQITRVARALPDFRRAVHLAPHRDLFRLRLALALVRLDQASEAWGYLEELLPRSPNDPDVLLGAARCLRVLTQPARARDHLDTLLRDHPNHADAWAERGLACSDLGDTAEAVRSLRRAFDLEPYSYSIAFALFTQLQGAGHTHQANALRQRVEALKRDEERVQDLMKQDSNQPPSAARRHEVGVILLRNNSEAAALSWFFRALQADPGHRPTHQALAEYYQRKGNTQAASQHRQRAAGGQ